MPNFFKKKPLISGGFEVLLKQGFKVNGLFNMKNLERYMRENVLDDNHFKSLGVNLNIVGEIRDTLSTHVASDTCSDLVISSYSIQPYHFNKEIGSLHEYGIPAIFNQALYQLVQQKIEKHIDHQKRIKSLINTVNG